MMDGFYNFFKSIFSHSRINTGRNIQYEVPERFTWEDLPQIDGDQYFYGFLVLLFRLLRILYFDDGIDQTSKNDAPAEIPFRKERPSEADTDIPFSFFDDPDGDASELLAQMNNLAH